MDEILVVNTGSSSVKTALFEITETGLRPKAAPPSSVVAVGHRIVHGGAKFTQSTLITPEVLKEIEELSDLAPLHNPKAIGEIKKQACYGVPQVAVFDTAFFAGLPDVSATYALPLELSQKYGLRRFGFHGIAHASMWRAWEKLKQGSKLITLQLGAGCSAAALQNGQPLDTSMGFTPLEGLIMATRPGDLDPGLLLYLSKKMDEPLDKLLYEQSGLLGLSGLTGEMKTLLASQEPSAKLAVDCFCHKLIKTIGAYSALLQGTDGLIFSGGIGENSPEIRQRVLSHLKLPFDRAANLSAHSLNPGELKALGDRVFVFGSDENRTIAEETVRLLSLK